MITINIPSGVKQVTAPTSLYQWDYGQKLQITGDNLPTACQIHFCDKTCKETIVRVAGMGSNGLEVAIPDVLLENEYPINAFIYVVEDGQGNTIKHIHIPVIKRKKPEDRIDPIPEKVQEEMELLIANINSAVDDFKALYEESLTIDELKILINELMGNDNTSALSTANSALSTANSALSTANSALSTANEALEQTQARRKIKTGSTGWVLNKGTNEKTSYIISPADGAGEYEIEIEVTTFDGYSQYCGIHTFKGYLSLTAGKIYYLVTDGWIGAPEDRLFLMIECKAGSNYSGQLLCSITLSLNDEQIVSGTIKNIYKRVTG